MGIHILRVNPERARFNSPGCSECGGLGYEMFTRVFKPCKGGIKRSDGKIH
jgi:hypothetical protein